ncbi:DUF2963 domain-containing protein [Candidatus Phytoplasma pruni]|uniref:DUF2963 domain-containing protein n=1 Tax=Candidatus Phytoplasma pruni TaxID=479893 RepID=A0A851HAP2_9MOLU|nr:DUF2963 domain-containing protein [Candidatus Phytoplasma pruni]NWN45977.1 DUF2963 domain-containing protein [Candidatus Phytoplasma pruni]
MNQTQITTDNYGYKTITEFNDQNEKIKETIYRPNETIHSLREFDPKTKKIIKFFHQNIENKILINEEYDPKTGKTTKSHKYRPDGSLHYILENNPAGKKIKYTFFRENNTLCYFEEYEPKTGKISKQAYFNDDGLLHSLVILIPKPGEENTHTFYRPDGSIKSRDWFKAGGIRINTIWYHPDGSIESEYQFDLSHLKKNRLTKQQPRSGRTNTTLYI